jgi:hypothetical protein
MFVSPNESRRRPLRTRFCRCPLPKSVPSGKSSLLVIRADLSTDVSNPNIDTIMTMTTQQAEPVELRYDKQFHRRRGITVVFLGEEHNDSRGELDDIPLLPALISNQQVYAPFSGDAKIENIVCHQKYVVICTSVYRLERNRSLGIMHWGTTLDASLSEW